MINLRYCFFTLYIHCCSCNFANRSQQILYVPSKNICNKSQQLHVQQEQYSKEPSFSKLECSSLKKSHWFSSPFAIALGETAIRASVARCVRNLSKPTMLCICVCICVLGFIVTLYIYYISFRPSTQASTLYSTSLFG